MVKNNDIQVVNATPKIDKTNISPYLFNLDRLEKTNCIMCQSEYRDEVEQMYESQKGRKNYLEIKSMLKTKYDFDISRNALRNHLIRHYGRAADNTALQDYVEEVQQWVNMQGNKVSSVKARIAVLEREYFTIANQSDDLDLFERRKNAECLKKLAEAIVLLEDKLEEYSEEAKPINILFKQLTSIVNEELQYVDNLASKKLVSKILSRLRENCGNMLME